MGACTSIVSWAPDPGVFERGVSELCPWERMLRTFSGLNQGDAESFLQKLSFFLGPVVLVEELTKSCGLTYGWTCGDKKNMYSRPELEWRKWVEWRARRTLCPRGGIKY